MAAVTSALLAMAAVGAAASIYGGIQAQEAGKKQASLAEAQASARATETARITERSVGLEQRNIDETAQQQQLAYLASGVTLEGSPLLQMEETRRRGAENIQEIKLAGAAGAAAQIAEGRTAANAAKASGRLALISSLGSATSYGATALTRKA